MIARPAVLADTGSMAAVDTLAGPFPWAEERLRRALSDGAGTEALVVEYGDDSDNLAKATPAACAPIAGFVLFACQMDEGTVLNIAVRPDRQGQGFGRSLLQAAMCRMRQAGMRRCLLEVRRSNDAALALYRGAGFVEDGVRKNYYPAAGGREDAILMSRSLFPGEGGKDAGI